MSRPEGKRVSYLSLWREFLTYNSTTRRFGLNRGLGKPGGMSVSTVFPEGYMENDRMQRHATSSIPKENEEGLNQERYRRIINRGKPKQKK